MTIESIEPYLVRGQRLERPCQRCRRLFQPSVASLRRGSPHWWCCPDCQERPVAISQVEMVSAESLPRLGALVDCFEERLNGSQGRLRESHHVLIVARASLNRARYALDVRHDGTDSACRFWP